MGEHMMARRKRPAMSTPVSTEAETLQRAPATPQQEVSVVPPIVDEVLQSSGQPLDTEARAFMEPRFGHEFGQVRVHTDDRAAQSAQAVNALAYTVGQDVVFGAGQYAPGTSVGQRLIAHELTHVVQQKAEPNVGLLPLAGRIGDKSSESVAPSSGQLVSSPIIRPQQSALFGRAPLGVSEPSQPHELEAEQTAQAVTQGEMPQRTVVHQRTSGSAHLVQRKVDLIKAPWWGSALSSTSDSNVWFNPHAQLWIGGRLATDSWFPDGPRAAFNISPGTSGTVRIIVDTGWFQDNIIFNYSGSATVIEEVDFTVTPEGTIQFQQAAPTTDTGGDAAELVIPVQCTSDRSPEGGYINVSPIIRSAGSVTSGSKLSVSSQGVGSELSAAESTPRVQGWQRSFRVDLVVPKDALKPNSFDIFAFFAVNSDRIEEASERFIVEWYEGRLPDNVGLTEDVRRSIEAGTTQIVLRGHASTTQPAPANRELSRRRAQRVQRILQDIAGSQAKFDLFALGEYQAGTPDEVEAKEERRVDIEITITSTGSTAPSPGGP